MLKVSVVTISFNQADFLERAIRSVLEQDYPNIEYIVVDPGSTDGSREIIARYEPAVRAILEPDRGPADGLNKGFAAATGDILGYINADDALLPHAIAEAVAEFEKTPDVDVLCGHGYKVDQDGNLMRPIHSDSFGLRRHAMGASSIVQQSTFFRRATFCEAGGFNIENRTCWDGELMVDFGLRRKNFRSVNKFWSIFTIHPGGITGSGRLNEQYRKDEARLFRKILGRERRTSDAAEALLYRVAKHASHPGRLLDIARASLRRRRQSKRIPS